MTRTVAGTLLISLIQGCGLLLDTDADRARQMDATPGRDAGTLDGSSSDVTRGDGASSDGSAGDGSSLDASGPDAPIGDSGTTSGCDVIGAPCMLAGTPGLCDADRQCSVFTCNPGDPCQVACSTGVLSCAGGTPTCLADNVASRGSVCRGSIDPLCDPPETCDGFDGLCPSDVISPDGAMCSVCGGSFACMAGRCAATSPTPEQGTCALGELCCGYACRSSECF